MELVRHVVQRGREFRGTRRDGAQPALMFPTLQLTRQLVQLWSRLLAVVLQQWLLLGSVWGELHGSLLKASRALQRHAVLLIAALGSREALIAMIERLGRLIRKTARQNKRKNPSTFELLKDPAQREKLMKELGVDGQ